MHMNTETNGTRLPTFDNETEAWIEQQLGLHVGLTREQLTKYLHRETDLSGAAHAPFPGPLREAFASGPRTVTVTNTAGAKTTFTLQPVTMALLSALERLESKFIQMVTIIGDGYAKPVAEGEDPKKRGAAIMREIDEKLAPKARELVATAWCFINSIDTVENELELGPEHVRALALKDLGRKLNQIEFGKLNAAIMLHYVESFSTSQDYRAKKLTDEASFPSAPAERATDSAGASISAAP